MKVMVAGDWHGNTRHAVQMVKTAKRFGIQHIVQCGDFGLWGGHDGLRYLDDLQAALRDNDVMLHWVDGNHENFDLLDAMRASHPKWNDKSGFTYLRSNIVHCARGERWRWDGKLFMAMGGAVSIDKRYRVEGRSWWEQESIREEEVYGVEQDMATRRRRGRARVDYLFTHDCSNFTPWKDRLKPDPESQQNRERLDRVLSAVEPRFQFHGHMHEKYEWTLSYATGAETKVYGLERDGLPDSWLVLDTANDSVKWPVRVHIESNYDIN